MIVRKTDSKKTALTICNYCDWQDSKTAKEQVKDSRKTAERQQKDTINNVNNSNNEEIIKDIRSVLPSEMTKDKATALKRIPIILRDYSADNIKKSIRLYIADVQKQRKTGFKDLKYLNEGTFWNGRYMTYIDEEETQNKPRQQVQFIRVEVTE
jgi:predicted ATPase with chaperone activity